MLTVGDGVEFTKWHVSWVLSFHLHCLALGLLWNG